VVFAFIAHIKGLARQLLEALGIEHAFFSGNDHLAVDLIAKGAAGSISIIGNLAARQWKDCIEEALLGNIQKAKELYAKLEPLCASLVLETNPQCVKYAMSLKGASSHFMRLPLLPPKSENRKIIEKEFITFFSS